MRQNHTALVCIGKLSNDIIIFQHFQKKKCREKKLWRDCNKTNSLTLRSFHKRLSLFWNKSWETSKSTANIASKKFVDRKIDETCVINEFNIVPIHFDWLNVWNEMLFCAKIFTCFKKWFTNIPKIFGFCKFIIFVHKQFLENLNARMLWVMISIYHISNFNWFQQTFFGCLNA